MGCLVQVFALAMGLIGTPQRSIGPEYPGQMYIIGRNSRSLMPLERTVVNADVAGMGARVTVRQQFKNGSEVPIEAVYTFPLPHDAAVDRMRISMGARVIEGTIMRREKARQVYEDAKNRGQTAALLDQETDNIFTQQVANIMPGQRIEVEISYVQLLKFEDGEFEFHFPMVVGPRFLGTGTPNPGKISPPTMYPGFRSGQNVTLTLNVHGGAPIRDYKSVLHQVNVAKPDEDSLKVELAQRNEIPNRDFIFRYRTTTDQVKEALFTTWDAKRGGYFALVLAPPVKTTDQIRTPKEMVFVLDQSGSQSGFPIEKSKELSLKLLETLKPGDTFNVMGFSNEVNPLWPAPRPLNSETKAEAQAFIKSIYANGGTELEKAVVASLSPALDPNRVRIVLFNTDGYAGQEPVILRNVQQYRGLSRLFTFGIGSSVNRSLIDAMSYEGRGASEIVTLPEKADDAVARFAQRMDNPVLVDVKAKFDGNLVEQLTPTQIPDVFSTKPVVIYGRYSKPGRTTLTLSGISGGHEWVREVDVDLPKTVGDGSAVSSLWARTRLAELKSESYTAAAFGKKLDVTEKITQIALDHGIMSEYTSFVAVDKSVSNTSGTSTTVQVPVEMPEGVSMGLPMVASGQAQFTGTLSRTAPGGFGGSRGVVVAKPANRIIVRGGSVDFISADPADNSFVVLSDKETKHQVRVAEGLLKTTGSVQIRIWVSKVSPEILAALKKAGVKVLSHDGSNVVFAEGTGDQIKKLADLEFVIAVDWFRKPATK